MPRPAYRTAHQRRRAQLAGYVATGTVRCARCRELIAPGQAWDLDHEVAVVDGGARGQSWPSHRSCNRAHGAELAHQRSAKSRHAYGRPPRSWPAGDLELDDPAQVTPAPPPIPFFVY